MSSAVQFVDDPEKGCYEALIGDHIVGVMVYKRLGRRVVVRHTVVEPEYRGQGLGAQLVRAFLDDVRDRDDTLTNYCSFVVDFIACHPEYQGIVNIDRPGVTSPRGVAR